MGFPLGYSGKESTCQCRRHKRRGFDSWVGRSHVRGSDNPLQNSQKTHGQRRLVVFYIWKLTIFNKNQHYWRIYLQILYDLSDIWEYAELIPCLTLQRVRHDWATEHTQRTMEVTQTVKSHLPCRRPKFNSWVGKIPWRREWLSTPVFCPAEFYGQRNMGFPGDSGVHNTPASAGDEGSIPGR